AETEATLGSDVLQLAGPKGLKKLFEPGPDLEMKKPGIVFKTGKQRLAVRRGRQALAFGGAAGLAMTGVGAPLAPLALLMPDLARFGVKHFAGPIETIVRITPYLEAANDTKLLRYVKSIENAAGPPRAPGVEAFKGYTKTQKKVAGDIASDLVKRFQFDYTDVTPFEQNFIRTVFPFYTYYRKNFVVQAQELARQPRTVVGLNAMHNFLDEQAGPIGPMDQTLPWYFANMDAFHLPIPNWMKEQLGVPRDQPVYVNPKLPYATLNMFPPLWELMNHPDQPTPQIAGQILAPVFGSIGPHTLIPGSKIAMEYVSGWSFGMARPIDFQRRSSNDYRDSSTDAPFYAPYIPKPLRHWLGIAQDKRGRYMMSASNKYILEQTASPFISNFGSSIPPEGATDSERGRALANRVAWVTGFRLMPADMHRLSKNWAYGVKNLLEAKQSDLQHNGGHLPVEDEKLLEELRIYVDVAKSVDDQTYIEQYGKPPGAP
ncbi:MAG TPA: hypothetical protein VNS88_16235, partial [Nitrospiraceae bacterium]|nr:hypothetical protein [Nitrospiraceae bacterium]